MKNTTARYTIAEELFNSISHGIGILLSIIGLVMLLIKANNPMNAYRIISYSVFGASLIFQYAASTIYHAAGEKHKWLLNKIDHTAIYVLIAGTYTPFLLITLRGAWGWSIFGVIWAIAIAGVLFKVFFYTHKLRKLSAVLYLLMGWLIVVVAKPLFDALPSGGLYWLAIGGFCYTFGIIFYIKRSIPFGHPIWHLFVLGGSISHFLAIYFYV